MARLVLLIAFIAVLATAFASISVALRGVSAQTGTRRGNATMPKTFQTIAFILLIVLMLGIASGFVGGL